MIQYFLVILLSNSEKKLKNKSGKRSPAKTRFHPFCRRDGKIAEF